MTAAFGPAEAVRAAEAAARDAGRYLISELGVVGPGDASEKGPSDFVSRVDRNAETMIRRSLAAAAPGVPVLGEEGGGDPPGTGATWVVDPLDGTTNFLHGFPVFAVSIAYLLDGRPVAGAIYDPNRDEMFAGSEGNGVTLGDAPLKVSGRGSLGEAFIATGFPSRFKNEADAYLAQFRRVLVATAGVRRAGSAALDLAYVACGRFDGFWEPRLSLWDMAAGVCLVREAGGIVADEAGRPWTAAAAGVIASSPAVHDAFVGALAPAA